MPRLVSRADADSDVETAFDWYEAELPGLGQQFLNELERAYERIAAGPSRYQRVAGEIRRVLLRRFPYAVYFVAEGKWSRFSLCCMQPGIQLNGSDAYKLRVV